MRLPRRSAPRNDGVFYQSGFAMTVYLLYFSVCLHSALAGDIPNFSFFRHCGMQLAALSILQTIKKAERKTRLFELKKCLFKNST